VLVLLLSLLLCLVLFVVLSLVLFLVLLCCLLCCLWTSSVLLNSFWPSCRLVRSLRCSLSVGLCVAVCGTARGGRIA